MSLFGETCARCGKRRTKGRYEGVPTCDKCKELLERKLAAAHESRRRCPIDAAEMDKEIVLNLILDRCPTCHGVWLDPGELEQLEDTIEEGLAKVLVQGMIIPG
jgi:hypothetical protein